MLAITYSYCYIEQIMVWEEDEIKIEGQKWLQENVL